MNPLVILRALALLFADQGRAREADALGKLADLVQSGANVNAAMDKLAELLKADGGTGSSISWDDLHAELAAESDKLQARPS